MRENADQNNSEYRHFLRSESMLDDFSTLCIQGLTYVSSARNCLLYNVTDRLEDLHISFSLKTNKEFLRFSTNDFLSVMLAKGK